MKPPHSPVRLFFRRFFMTVVALELAIVAIAATFWFYPPSALFALALAGRSPICKATEVLSGAERRIRLNAEIERLTKDSTIVERDSAGYDLWRTPMGDYWAPAGPAGASLPVLLAQQSVDNYGDGDLAVQEGDIVLDGGAHRRLRPRGSGPRRAYRRRY